MRHQYRMSAIISQTPFGGETSGSITKCLLFPQANIQINNYVKKQLQQCHLPTSCHATSSFPANQHVRNKCRNFILMTSHCPDLGSGGGSDWRKQIFLVAQPIRGTIQTWIVTHNQCGI